MSTSTLGAASQSEASQDRSVRRRRRSSWIEASVESRPRPSVRPSELRLSPSLPLSLSAVVRPEAKVRVVWVPDGERETAASSSPFGLASPSSPVLLHSPSGGIGGWFGTYSAGGWSCKNEVRNPFFLLDRACHIKYLIHLF